MTMELSNVIRVSQYAYKLLESMSRKTGKSLKDLADEAIISYFEPLLLTDVSDISIVAAKAPTQTKCASCGKTIKPKETVYYLKLNVKHSNGIVATKVYPLCWECLIDRGSEIVDRELSAVDQ